MLKKDEKKNKKCKYVIGGADRAYDDQLNPLIETFLFHRPP